MRTRASQMAFGGMMTAVAVVIMNLGSLIPVNTYVCPVLCILLTTPVKERCGNRLAWCYYLAVTVLALLLAPDREAALVYAFLGYYPMIRHLFEKLRPAWLALTAKIVYFTLAGTAAYVLTMFVLGVEGLLEEIGTVELWMLVITVLLWDILFVLVDRLLGLKFIRRRRS